MPTVLTVLPLSTSKTTRSLSSTLTPEQVHLLTVEVVVHRSPAFGSASVDGRSETHLWTQWWRV